MNPFSSILVKFQSTLPRGERPFSTSFIVFTSFLFQSTLPRGERRKELLANIDSKIFQSTLPRGERRTTTSYNRMPGVFQSTLPRGERQWRLYCFSRSISISIHAPARGATHEYNTLTNAGLFQSTLPRGERLYKILSNKLFIQFQSTLPRGERPVLKHLRRYPNLISIHAPARGATKIAINSVTGLYDFNPRSREGSDVFERSQFTILHLFQSTLPRGERLHW